MKKYFRLVPYLVVLVSVVIAVFLLVKYLKVGNITCTSQFGPCSGLIDEKLDDFQGLPIFESLNKVKKYLSEDKKVSDFSVRFNLPNTFKVYIVEKKGVVAVGRQGLDKYFILDENAKVIAVEKNTPLPILSINGSQGVEFSENSQAPENIIFASELLRKMFLVYGVKLANFYDDRIEFKLNNGPKIIMPVDGDQDVLLGSLTLILSRLNNASQEIRIGEIDLRYKNPVIR